MVEKNSSSIKYRRKAITIGKSTKDRGVRRKLRERDKKVDIRRKLAKLIVKEVFESRSVIVLEDLPDREL
jgi:putative transposase